MAEQRVDASPFTCEGQFGTLDIAIVQEFGKLVIVDYKYGAGISVDPDCNSQLIYYALGISNQFNHNFQEVELVVIQPRAFHESGETIRTWTCSMNELISWEDKFRNGVKATEDPFARFESGKWCKFCPAATICPEIKDKAMKQAQIVFDDGAGVESVPAPHTIAIENLPTILEACDKLDSWITKVREHALHVLERGEPIAGFKLVEKRSIRKWIDPEQASKSAKRIFGDKAFSEPELLSPAQFEKACTSELAIKFMKERVSAVSSGVTMVHESDKRPAVIARTMFEEIETEPRKEITMTELENTPTAEVQPKAKKKATKIKKKVAKKKKSK
jgi:hypothetical protein